MPRIVEWTGGRRPPGDEVVPSDLRVDHVYLVSCKYLSGILHNPSPARLVDGLLGQGPVEDARDWYERVAPAEYQRLYEVCAGADPDLPEAASELTSAQRRASRPHWTTAGRPAGSRHTRTCAGGGRGEPRRPGEAHRRGHRRDRRVAAAAHRLGAVLRARIQPGRRDAAPDRHAVGLAPALQARRLRIEPQVGGQPRVGWSVAYEQHGSTEERFVRGHVEIRWSHGRFAQPPEAKVYLDSRHEDVPGYHCVWVHRRAMTIGPVEHP